MDNTIRDRDFRMGNLKWAVSKEVTSKPTKAQGARMIRLKMAYPLAVPLDPKVVRAPPDMAWGTHRTAMMAMPANSSRDRTVWSRCSRGLATMKSTPTPPMTRADTRVSKG